MSQAFYSILFPDLIRNKVMVFKIFNRVLAEFLVGFTFVSFCAWIVEQESTELDFEPCWNVRIAIKENYCLGDSRHDNTCILLSTEIHGLVLKFREFLVEFLYCHVIEHSCLVVIIWSIASFWKSDFSGTFDDQKVGIFVPVERIYSEVLAASHKDERTFWVESTVQSRASRPCRYSDDERVFEWIAFWGEIVVVIGLSWWDVKIAGVVGMGKETDGKLERINPVSVVFSVDLGKQ